MQNGSDDFLRQAVDRKAGNPEHIHTSLWTRRLARYRGRYTLRWFNEIQNGDHIVNVIAARWIMTRHASAQYTATFGALTIASTATSVHLKCQKSSFARLAMNSNYVQTVVDLIKETQKAFELNCTSPSLVNITTGAIATEASKISLTETLDHGKQSHEQFAKRNWQKNRSRETFGTLKKGQNSYHFLNCRLKTTFLQRKEIGLSSTF